MVCPVVADNVEAEPVVVLGPTNRFHLAGEEVDLGRRLRLVRVVDLKVPLPDLTLPLLPDVPESPFGALVQVAGLPTSEGGVALGLVNVVLPAHRGSPTVLEERRRGSSLKLFKGDWNLVFFIKFMMCTCVSVQGKKHHTYHDSR